MTPSKPAPRNTGRAPADTLDARLAHAVFPDANIGEYNGCMFVGAYAFAPAGKHAADVLSWLIRQPHYYRVGQHTVEVLRGTTVISFPHNCDTESLSAAIHQAAIELIAREP